MKHWTEYERTDGKVEAADLDSFFSRLLRFGLLSFRLPISLFLRLFLPICLIARRFGRWIFGRERFPDHRRRFEAGNERCGGKDVLQSLSWRKNNDGEGKIDRRHRSTATALSCLLEDMSGGSEKGCILRHDERRV